MTFLLWVVLGLLAGLIAGKIVNNREEGVAVDTLLGIFGAILGGLFFEIYAGTGIGRLNLNSLAVAVVGAIAVLLAYHAFHRTA